MIRIFAMKIEASDDLVSDREKYLSEERRAEASRRRDKKEQQLFLGAEILLNRSLELTREGIRLPVSYRRNSHGKPYLLPPNEDIYVNWSHSGEYVLCAVSDREVGIDLQYMERQPGEALVRKLLQPEELEYYKGKESADRERLFYEYWAVKESYLKALGTGFSIPLDTFYICMEGEYPRIVRRDGTQSGEEAYACRLPAFEDERYVASVCGIRAAEEILISYLS